MLFTGREQKPGRWPGTRAVGVALEARGASGRPGARGPVNRGTKPDYFPDLGQSGFLDFPIPGQGGAGIPEISPIPPRFGPENPGYFSAKSGRDFGDFGVWGLWAPLAGSGSWNLPPNFSCATMSSHTCYRTSRSCHFPFWAECSLSGTQPEFSLGRLHPQVEKDILSLFLASSQFKSFGRQRG
jgi:hypothetical protein